MKNNNFYKLTPARFIGSIFFLTAIFALASSAAQAQIVYTTVASSDPDNGSAQALITVFDAETGRQIANGLTDAETGQFRFAAAAEQSFVIAALTESDYVGSARGTAGSSVSVDASQAESSMDRICYVSGNITLNYTNAGGAPLKNARISLVDSNTFANVRRGKTNQQGQYNFNIPDGLYGEGFLAAVWKGSGAVSLKLITPGCYE